jgi:hypothetical protein
MNITKHRKNYFAPYVEGNACLENRIIEIGECTENAIARTRSVVILPADVRIQRRSDSIQDVDRTGMQA